jgi:hypothetical protein
MASCGRQYGEVGPSIADALPPFLPLANLPYSPISTTNIGSPAAMIVVSNCLASTWPRNGYLLFSRHFSP